VASAATASSSKPVDDPRLPEIPAAYDVNELRAAVGASPLPASTAGKARDASSDADDDSDPGEPRRRRSSRTVAVSALAIITAIGVAAVAVVGVLNSDRYLLACEAERAVPEQGRGFPPWGARAMSGEQWRPLKIAAQTRCQTQETDDVLVLERAYLAMVLDQASALLTAREVTRFDEAEGLLKQALLLTRPPQHEPEPLARQRAEHHQDVERLLGDVTYWRAAAKLRDAATALGDAARQFDAAVTQHPRHVSDAAAWAAYARKLAQELHAGPAGATSPAVSPTTPASASPPSPAPATASASPPSPAPSTATPPSAASPSPSPSPAAPPVTAEHPDVPVGVALPVEPERTNPSPAAPPPDAGPPTGGVLL
jgi:hypothetical protein